MFKEGDRIRHKLSGDTGRVDEVYTYYDNTLEKNIMMVSVYIANSGDSVCETWEDYSVCWEFDNCELVINDSIIPCSLRYPTKDDADKFGTVFMMDNKGKWSCNYYNCGVENTVAWFHTPTYYNSQKCLNINNVEPSVPTKNPLSFFKSEKINSLIELYFK